MVTVRNGVRGINEGDEFGSWKVIGPPFRFGHSPAYRAVVRCQCGRTAVAAIGNLKTERSTRCTVCGNTTHGHSRERLHHVWRGMIDRCHNTENIGYSNYGGRGIYVCREWRDSYDAFKTWAESHGYADDLQIDRRNNDGCYEPSNCRWVSSSLNNRNRRSTVLLTAFGETKSLKDWAEDERCKVSYGALHDRIRNLGWDAERAITTNRRSVG